MGGKKLKVLVGMSGGVDSSVAALLLKHEGYEVTGAFIKVWQPDFLPCMAEDDRKDAMRVAAHLGIPFLTFNFADEYKKGVVDYMISEYAAGRTPNPDAMCNREIKFGAFLREALARGADYIATGHYARVIKNTDGFHLLAGIDRNKDQSYFLYTLGQKELSRTLFPIGEYTKPQVRAIAEKAGLPTAQKKDSQGLCFVGKLNMKEFLARYIPSAMGEVHDGAGRVVGSHDGAAYYTIGQRHGFTVRAESAQQSPYYVVGKDIVSNTLTVSHTPKTTLSVTERPINIHNARWTNQPPEAGKRYQARLRYRQVLAPCRVEIRGIGKALVHFKTLPALVPSGQSLVIYDGAECLGGGVII